MIESDLKQFGEVMNVACEMAGKKPFSSMALQGFFESLREYPLEQVSKALFSLSNSEDVAFGIRVDLIKKHMGIRGDRDLSWQDVIEMARKPTTPMAVLARIHIKSHYLNSYQPMEIKHRADTFLDKLEETKARAAAGEYDEHEIVTMIDHGVKVSSPFMEGMPSIGQNRSLRLKYDKAIRSPLHLENVARIESRERNGLPPNREGQLKVLSEMKNLLSDGEPTQSEINQEEAVYNRLMNKAGE